MKTQNRKPQNDVNANERAIQALKLRKLGVGYDEIAKQCGYANKGIAWNAIHRLLSRQKVEAVEELRTLEAQRLDDLMRAFMLRAMKGESEAAAVVLRIMARRDALLGLDMSKADAQNVNCVVIREVPTGLLPLPVEAQNGHSHS